jgi:hypothetical protein
MMEVGVKTVGFDISPFEAGGELGPEVRARIMQMLALNVAEVIWSRVNMGVTPDGAPFRKYTPAYEKWKRSKGRSPGSKGDWLTFTGQMLGAIKPLYFDGDRFLLGFDSGRGDGRSNALIAWVNDRTRPFFSLSEDERMIAWQNTLAQAQQEGLIQ